MEGHGLAGHVTDWLGMSRNGRSGTARNGMDGQGAEGHGESRNGMAGTAACIQNRTKLVPITTNEENSDGQASDQRERNRHPEDQHGPHRDPHHRNHAPDSLAGFPESGGAALSAPKAPRGRPSG